MPRLPQSPGDIIIFASLIVFLHQDGIDRRLVEGEVEPVVRERATPFSLVYSAGSGLQRRGEEESGAARISGRGWLMIRILRLA